MPDRSFIDQLAEVWTSTANLCRSLDAKEWDLPTDCPGWTVRDNLSHMIGTESMLLGRAAPPPAPDGLAHVKNPIGTMNEAWIEARRATPAAALLSEFDEVTNTRLTELRAMTDEQLEVPTPSPIGNVPYTMFMDVRVMDCWTHEQDIRRAVGRPGHMDGQAAETAIRRFSSSLGFVVGKRAAAPEGSTVVLSLSGPLARTLALAVEGGRAAAIDAPSDPTVTLRMDAETFVCLVAGRWDPATAPVSIDGDTTLGRAIVDNLATIP